MRAGQGKRVYISGPITGKPDGNRPAFEHAKQALIAAGDVPVNPHENGLPSSASWREHMRADLRMLADCDAILLLPGWASSKGAFLEQSIAQFLGMSILVTLPVVDAMKGA
jgi:hypothetical protein